MIEKLKRLFATMPKEGDQDKANKPLEIAVTALLVQAAYLDDLEGDGAERSQEEPGEVPRWRANLAWRPFTSTHGEMGRCSAAQTSPLASEAAASRDEMTAASMVLAACARECSSTAA